MTVAELIEKLSGLPSDLLVVVDHHNSNHDAVAAHEVSVLEVSGEEGPYGDSYGEFTRDARNNGPKAMVVWIAAHPRS